MKNIMDEMGMAMLYMMMAFCILRILVEFIKGFSV